MWSTAPMCCGGPYTAHAILTTLPWSAKAAVSNSWLAPWGGATDHVVNMLQKGPWLGGVCEEVCRSRLVPENCEAHQPHVLLQSRQTGAQCEDAWHTVWMRSPESDQGVQGEDQSSPIENFEDPLVEERAGVWTAQLVRTAGTPMITYVVEALRMSYSHLEESRRTTARAASAAAGGWRKEFRFGPLCLQWCSTRTMDPALDAHALPIQTGAMAWWESWRSPDFLGNLFA